MEYLQLYPAVSYDVGRLPAAASIASPRLVAQAQARLGTTAPPMLARRHSHRELAAAGGRRGGGDRERPSPPPASPSLSSSLPERDAAPLRGWGTATAAAAASASAQPPSRSATGHRRGSTMTRGGGVGDRPAATACKGKIIRSASAAAATVAVTAVAPSVAPAPLHCTAPSPRSVLGLAAPARTGTAGLGGRPPRPEVPAPAGAAAIAGRACENCGREHLRLADAVEDCIFRAVYCSAECYWSHRFRREEATRPRTSRH